MNRTTRMRRTTLFALTLSLFAASCWPLSPDAFAQSGRKIPEKARKQQPAPSSGTTPPAPGSTSAPDERPQDVVTEPIDPSAPPPPRTTKQDIENAVELGVDVVGVQTVVYEKKSGAILRDLKRENFQIFEDGVRQEIENFAPSDGPITLVVVIEFSRNIDNRYLSKLEVLRPANYFVTRFTQPGDNIAIVAYDTRPEVVTDFTSDPRKLAGGIDFLLKNYPATMESNLYDTLNFVLKGGPLNGQDYGGLAEVEGRSAIMLISLGIDTFSKVNFGEIRETISKAGVPIYTIGVGNLFYKKNETFLSAEQNLTWLQAFNTLRGFSRMSGGQYFPITFAGEIPSSMQSISNLLRSQYNLGYVPTNERHQGKTRKIEVKVDVDGDGKTDDKTYVVQHRESYVEPNDNPKKRK